MKTIENILKKIEYAIPLYHITIPIVIGFVIYGKALFNNFLWDDEDQIVNNPLIQHPKNIPYFFTRSTFYTGGAASGLAGLYYRPLMSIVFAINYSLWGLNPFGFHLFDISLHIVNSILAFFLIKRLLDLHKYHFSKTVAFIGSLLFLVHPANVESVAYISATSEVLYTFFLLIGVNLSLSVGFNRKSSPLALSMLSLMLLFSLFSKESGIIAIPIILFLSLLYFRKKFLFLLIPSIISIGVYTLFRFVFAHLSGMQNSSVVPIAQASLLERLLTVPYELFSYLRIIFFPKDLHISQQDIIRNVADPHFYLSFIVVLLVFAGVSIAVIKVKSKLLVFFLLWFFMPLVLVLNIIPLDFTVEERWLYVPLIGFIGGLSLFFSAIFTANNKLWKAVTVSIICIALVLFSLRTFVRTFDWADAVTLFGHDVVLSDFSAELHTNYGTALYKKGNLKESEKEYLKALELAPDNLWALNNLGSIYATEGNYEKAKPLYLKSIQLAPTYAAYENLAQIYYFTEKPSFVIEFLKQALPLFPNSAKLNQLAALSYNAIGAADAAKTHAQKAAMLDPSQKNIGPLIPILK